MNSMDLFKAFGDIDESLMFDAINGGEQPQNSSGVVPVKQPRHNKPPRGGAKTKAIVIGAVAIVLAAAITVLALYLTGVIGGKQVPIYTGMEISAVNTSADDGSKTAVSYKYSGDYTGRNDDVDKNNPYGSGGTTIEQQASSTLAIVSAGEDIYYANAGDDIYVKINFDNPDKYDIVSFSLSDGTNTYDYSGLLGNFEDGSTYTQIIIKLNVGTTGGIIEYSISKIKYLDDNSVNSDVIIGGETVVRCGVRTSDITYATISDEATTLTSISFTAEIVDKYSLISYSGGYVTAILFDGESIIQMQNLSVGSNTVLFDDLDPDTLYQYAVAGYYDALSGSGAALNYLYKNAVYTPAIVLFDEDSIVIGQESISFGYSWYTGYESSITSLTLTHGGETQNLDAQTTSITGLLSNNDYALTATYNGTNGETSTITLEFTTEAKATPSVEITVTNATTTSLTFNVDFNDTDGVGEITAVELYDGETLVQSASSLNQVEYIFSGLDAYTNYTLKVSYSYDLNDGVGTQTAEQTITENTYPSVEISSVSLGNTSTVTEGGTISITANINNPNGVTFKSVVINDETYSVLSISNTSTMYVNITNDGQFAGGNTTLTISRITCTIDGETYNIDINETNTVEAFIYGALTVENFYIARYNSTTEKYEETNYGFANEQLYYVISLGNGTKYNINSITIGGVAYSSSEITLSSDYQMVYIPVYTESVADTVSSITYSYGSDSNKKKSFNVSFGYFRALSSSEIVKIATAEQLLDVDGNAYYILMNDIDVSEYTAEWVNMNNNMYGVFDGNGYTISGIGAVTDYYDSDLNIGLFNQVNGVVTNLTVSAYYNVSLYNTTSGSYNVYAGGLAAVLSDGAIYGSIMADNVNVTFTAAITLNGTINVINVGGICGKKANYYGETIVINSTVKTNISITAKNSNNGGEQYAELNIGGLFGNLDYLFGILEENKVSNTNVMFTAYITLENSSNYSLHLGGIVGFLFSSMSVFDVSVNANVTVAGELGYGIICGIVGYCGGTNLYNTTSNMTVYLDSDLYDRFIDGDGSCNYYEYNDPNSGGAVADENCSSTITVNEIS